MSQHIPVLLQEVLFSLNPKAGEIFVDGTFGAGGYTRALLDRGARVIALDQDPLAAQIAQTCLAEYPENFQFKQMNFAELSQLHEEYPDGMDGVVLDVGVSSMQVDEAARGFSFNKEGPLDMRMSQSGLSAADVVNEWPEAELARIFYILGEEKESRQFARAIVEERAQTKFTTTLQLAQLIKDRSRHQRYGRPSLHPATKVFQALRIYVNDELGALVEALFAAEQLLREEGRLVVVTFHSLEDRIVKRFLAARMTEVRGSRHLPELTSLRPSFAPVVKGAQKPSPEEINYNPRARSAKLRAACRTGAPAHPHQVSEFFADKFPRLHTFWRAS